MKVRRAGVEDRLLKLQRCTERWRAEAQKCSKDDGVIAQCRSRRVQLMATADRRSGCWTDQRCARGVEVKSTRLEIEMEAEARASSWRHVIAPAERALGLGTWAGARSAQIIASRRIQASDGVPHFFHLFALCLLLCALSLNIEFCMMVLIASPN